MEAKKIDIIDRTTKQKSLIKKFMDAISRVEPPFVNGNNFFAGALDGTLDGACFRGSMGMTSSAQDNWEEMWRLVGQPVPGKLPRGASATLEIISEKGKQVDLSLSRIEKTDQGLELDWNIEKNPASDEKKQGMFVIIVFPGKPLTTNKFNYKTPAQDKNPGPSI